MDVAEVVHFHIVFHGVDFPKVDSGHTVQFVGLGPASHTDWWFQHAVFSLSGLFVNSRRRRGFASVYDSMIPFDETLFADHLTTIGLNWTASSVRHRTWFPRR